MVRSSIGGVLGVCLLGLAACGSSDTGGGANPPDSSDPDAVAPDTDQDAGADIVEDSDLPQLDIPQPDVPVEPSCAREDNLSPNHSIASARDLGDRVLERNSLYLCSGADDFYRVRARAGSVVRARIDLTNQVGDLDLYLLPVGADADPAQAVASGATTADTESLVYVSPTDAEYIVWVQGFEGAEGRYDARISVSCDGDAACAEGGRCSALRQGCVDDSAATCGQDAQEPNDALAMVPPLAVNNGVAVLSGLRVCPEDDDYFAVTLDAVSRVFVEVTYEPAAQLRVVLFDPAGRVAATSTPDYAVARLDAGRLAPGRWTIGVADDGSNFDVPYGLRVEVRPDASCVDNSDCNNAGARAICDAGACVPFLPAQRSAAGGPCVDRTHCDGGLVCNLGGAGFEDNFCTTTCTNSAGCGLFDNGWCQITGRNSGVCWPGCDDDLDCPFLYACQGSGACDLEPCGRDADCTAPRLCLRSEQNNTAVCTASPAPTCREDDALEPNNRLDEAAPLGPAPWAVRSAQICDADDDWYALEVAGGSTIRLEVEYDADVNIDLWLHDAQGRLVAAETEGTPNPVRLEARYLVAGTYYLRVNQVGGTAASQALYVLTGTQIREVCESNTPCESLQPLRPACSDGGCGFIDGNGQIPPGGVCDSDDDCNAEAQFCWVFELGTARRNICTRGCGNDADCGDIEGASCVRFGRNFAACLPG